MFLKAGRYLTRQTYRRRTINENVLTYLAFQIYVGDSMTGSW